MLTKSVYRLMPGDKLVEDVLTPLGSLLLTKDTVLTQREIDIIIAFTIESVKVAPSANDGLNENELTKEKGAAKKAAPKDLTPELSEKEMFIEHYKKMLEVMRNVNNAVNINEPIPLLDIRNQLDELFQYIDFYNVISFTPPNFVESDYALHKSVVTALTSYYIAKASNQPKKDWMPIALAGLLMDIGNQKIERNILNKEGKLTHAEMDIIKKHTEYGYLILSNQTAINKGVKLTALQHHERIDGTGYPLKLNGESIHIYAKICAIADIYHAMTLNKVYRKAISPYLVMEQIQSDAFGKLDPVLVSIFIESLTKFNIGSRVKLNDGRIGEIVFVERSNQTRPWVNVDSEIINLSLDRSFHIVEVLS